MTLEPKAALEKTLEMGVSTWRSQGGFARWKVQWQEQVVLYVPLRLKNFLLVLLFFCHSFLQPLIGSDFDRGGGSFL